MNTQNTKCWYSMEGLKDLNRNQRQGVILSEKDGKVSVLWDMNKTPSYYAKRFITTDPLAQLIGDSQEKSPYINIDEKSWFSIEKNKVYIVVENRNEQGEYISSDQYTVHLEAVVETIDRETLINAVKSFIK